MFEIEETKKEEKEAHSEEDFEVKEIKSEDEKEDKKEEKKEEEKEEEKEKENQTKKPKKKSKFFSKILDFLKKIWSYIMNFPIWEFLLNILGNDLVFYIYIGRQTKKVTQSRLRGLLQNKPIRNRHFTVHHPPKLHRLGNN